MKLVNLKNTIFEICKALDILISTIEKKQTCLTKLFTFNRFEKLSNFMYLIPMIEIISHINFVL